ncbi:hypothetical protein CEXT_225411 [Caerostris extrusa]|uniref:Uncharacterized protein n=1 Tax=Caerostris extrusa TaxID=172846 RepID=A0AAV4PL08_CAEEX|nr:hypothetical protein CEXT_225411 [Caerostris extrusa]
MHHFHEVLEESTDSSFFFILNSPTCSIWWGYFYLSTFSVVFVASLNEGKKSLDVKINFLFTDFMCISCLKWGESSHFVSLVWFGGKSLKESAFVFLQSELHPPSLSPIFAYVLCLPL